MMAVNGTSDLETTEEPLSPPETPLFNTTPASTPTELHSPVEPPADEEERKKLQEELAEVELDITALRQTLTAKQQKAKELKRRLGITPMLEMKEKARQSWGSVQQSNAFQSTSTKLKEWNEVITQSDTYNKTKEGLHTAGQKTGSALSSFGSAFSRKLGEVRESNTFKSFEEAVSSAATSVKTKVTRQPKETTFEDALQESSAESGKDPLDTTDDIPLDNES